MQEKEGYLLCLDAGTGSVRGILFDLKGQLIHKETRARHYIPDPSGEPLLQAFDPDTLWSNICHLIGSLILKTKIKPESILVISSTGQRFSYVFLDAMGEVLYAGPNLDPRGVFTQADIEARLGKEYYLLTGQWPPMTSALARLLWFRQEATAVFSRIRTVLMLNDWILHKLCGKNHVEVSAASASGLLEIATGQWSEGIQKAFDLDASILPPIFRSGEVLGTVLPPAASQTGLQPGTPVVVGGADTQCALLGAGLWGPDQLGVIAGTTAPVCRLMDSPCLDPEQRLWTSCHLEPRQWTLEANSQWAGFVVQWLIDLLSSVVRPSCSETDLYGWVEKQAAQVPAGAQDTFAFLGPIVMDAKNLAAIRPGVFFFPPPVHPLTESPARAGHFLRASLENIAFAIRGNLELVLHLEPFQPDRICLTGGLANSRLFCQILSDCLGLPVSVGLVREASALGSAVCAAKGIGAFSNLEEAQKAIVHLDEHFEPEKENARIYQTAYERWKELYQKIEDL